MELSSAVLPQLASFIIRLVLNVWFNRRKYLAFILAFYCLRIILLDICYLLDVLTNTILNNSLFSGLYCCINASLVSILFPNLSIIHLMDFLGLSKIITILSNLINNIAVDFYKPFVVCCDSLRETVRLFLMDFLGLSVIHCDSPREVARLFSELPFVTVDTLTMITECDNNTSLKTKKTLKAEFEAFRIKCQKHTPGNIVSNESAFYPDKDIIEQAEPSKGQKGKGVKRPLDNTQGHTPNKRPNTRLYNTRSKNISMVSVKENTSANLESAMDYTITSDDFSYDFLDSDSIHTKITKGINKGKFTRGDRISKLVFESKSLKIDFYQKIKSLNFRSPKVSKVRLGSILNALDNYVETTPKENNNSTDYTNTRNDLSNKSFDYTITRNDFSNKSFDYGGIFTKISNFVYNEKRGINNHSLIGKLVFESEGLKIDLYQKIKDLNLTNFKRSSQTTIYSLHNMLMKKVGDGLFEGISITSEDFLGDFKHDVVHNKINQLTQDGEANIEDYVGKLKFKNENLRQPFYKRIIELNIARNKAARKIKLGALLKGLKKSMNT